MDEFVGFLKGVGVATLATAFTLLMIFGAFLFASWIWDLRLW